MTNQPTLTLTAEQIATLNNVRTILKRQLIPFSIVDDNLVADLLLQQAALMRDAGLAEELRGYLDTAIARVDEDAPFYRRLQRELALTMLHLGDYDESVREIYGELLDFYSTQPEDQRTDDYASAMLSFGEYFAARSRYGDALTYFQAAFKQFQREGLTAGSAQALHQIGLAYQATGQFDLADKAYRAALNVATTHPRLARIRAEVLADYANMMLQQGQVSQVEAALDEAFEICTTMGIWALRAKVIRQLAYVDQLRAREAADNDIRQQWFQQAKLRLQDAVAHLLTIHNTAELAITYHDLGRLEAQIGDHHGAESHVRMSCDLFARIGNRRHFAVSQMTLGQIILIKDHDPDEALQHIRQALYISNDISDEHTRMQAAKALLKIHQMQVSRAKDKSDGVKAAVVEDIAYTQERLTGFGLTELAQSAGQLRAQLG